MGAQKTVTVEERMADASKVECYAKRDEWLERGVQAEAAGKSETMVRLTIKKAGEYEAAGLAKGE